MSFQPEEVDADVYYNRVALSLSLSHHIRLCICCCLTRQFSVEWFVCGFVYYVQAWDEKLLGQALELNDKLQNMTL